MRKLTLDCNAAFPLRGALERALAGAADADAPLVVELLFVSEEEIRALNAEKRGVDAVTDVLSFPADGYREGEPIRAAEHPDCAEPVTGMRGGERVQKGVRLYLGSIVICTKRAEEQAAEYGHSREREICYLAVHGFLHCLGYDHGTEEEKKRMRAREEEIMQTLGLGREE